MGESDGGDIDAVKAALTREIEAGPQTMTCVRAYRNVIRARRVLFHMYEEKRVSSYGHYVGLVTWIFAKDEATGQLDVEIPDFLLDAWRQLRLKKSGQPERSMTLILRADLLVLATAPNAHLHLLRDALRLRLRMYKTKTERQLCLKDCIIWAQNTTGRVWKREFGAEPGKPAKDWWVRTARALGLLSP